MVAVSVAGLDYDLKRYRNTSLPHSIGALILPLEAL